MVSIVTLSCVKKHSCFKLNALSGLQCTLDRNHRIANVIIAWIILCPILTVMLYGKLGRRTAAAFIPTPNMKRIRPPPHRPLRPTSSSIAGSAARRDPNFVAAAMAARRATMSARPGHLKSNVPLGNQGLRTRANWATTYSEAHTGRQEVRPSTVPTGVGRRGASRGSEQGMGGL